ncbi:MAG: leucine-rich repeat domain-containing protein, partial [Bacteroidaceae bacterium]|nr:leucine-rich repeat domain-containing protein [Bacteroidaceae bacterium]
MKKFIFTITSCLLCLSVSAYDFCIDEIFYNILASGNAVEVTHDYDSENSTTGSYKGKVTIPETVTHEGTTYQVTAIGTDAFAECARLTNVILPESITTIERKAFYDCSRLKEITIPQSVTNIGELAFYHCVKLESLNIPASVNNIGSKAFILCNGLTSLTVDNANTA